MLGCTEHSTVLEPQNVQIYECYGFSSMDKFQSSKDVK